MGRKGKRRRIAPGIYADGSGFAATVKVGDSLQREKRFTPSGDLSADLRKMQRWQLRTRATLLSTQPTRPASDTLAAAVPRFLATIPAGSTARRDYEKLLATWIASPIGLRPRQDIRRSDVLTQLSTWEADGYSAGTLNHRLRALRKLYDVLDSDDEDAINPCGKIQKRSEPEPEERGTSYELLEGILACLPDVGYAPRFGERPRVSKTKARLRVMAWTGLPPALIRQIRKEHIHWTEKVLDVMPRRKGKGVKARRLPLLDEAIDALRAFDAANAYGSYSNAAPWEAWRRAKRRYLEHRRASDTPPATVDAVAQVLATLRPYDLRHSFAAMVYEATGRQDAVKDLLMHGSLQTSERYIRRAVAPVSRAALDAVAAVRRGPLVAAESVVTPDVPAGASRSLPSGAVSVRNRPMLRAADSGEHQTKGRKNARRSAT